MLASTQPVNQKFAKILQLLTDHGLCHKQILKPAQMLCHPQNRGGTWCLTMTRGPTGTLTGSVFQALAQAAFPQAFPQTLPQAAFPHAAPHAFPHTGMPTGRPSHRQCRRPFLQAVPQTFPQSAPQPQAVPLVQRPHQAHPTSPLPMLWPSLAASPVSIQYGPCRPFVSVHQPTPYTPMTTLPAAWHPRPLPTRPPANSSPASCQQAAAATGPSQGAQTEAETLIQNLRNCQLCREGSHRSCRECKAESCEGKKSSAKPLGCTLQFLSLLHAAHGLFLALSCFCHVHFPIQSVRSSKLEGTEASYIAPTVKNSLKLMTRLSHHRIFTQRSSIQHSCATAIGPVHVLGSAICQP